MKPTFKQIFQNNYAALCNYALAIVKDKHTAEDLVQSVFVKLWEKEKLTQLDNPSAYLLKCVRYKCIDYLKSPKRKTEIFLEALPEMETEKVDSIKEEDILPLLQYFANQLPPKMKQVFLMSRHRGMTYKEIAEDLSISPKTVENQMGTALKKLRVLLRDHNYLPILLLFFQ